MQQRANDDDNAPHWYLEWNNEAQRLEGTLTDLPGRADRYQLMHTPGQPDDMKMAYAIINRKALTELGITGAASSEKYENLDHYIRNLANTEGIDINAAVEQTVEKIHHVNGANGRGFSFLNVDQFSRDFHTLIYIPNEQRELRVWKIDKDGNPLNNNYEYNFFGDDKSGFITNGGTIKLHHDESVTISGLLDGAKYAVTELNGEGYTTSTAGESGVIETGKNAVDSFINSTEREYYDSLAISKTVEGNAADADKLFTFTVTLGSADSPLEDVFKYNGSKKGAISSGGSIQLKGGESVAIIGLSENTEYTVTESDNEGYQVTQTGNTGSIAKDGTTSARFINTKNNPDNPDPPHEPDKPDKPDKPSKPKKHRLLISKTVEGTGADKAQEFTFTLTLTNSSGRPLNNTYTFSGSAKNGAEVPKKGTLKLNQNGEAEFTLKHGQSIIIDELPAGTQYSVKENDSQGYTVT